MRDLSVSLRSCLLPCWSRCGRRVPAAHVEVALCPCIQLRMVNVSARVSSECFGQLRPVKSLMRVLASEAGGGGGGRTNECLRSSEEAQASSFIHMKKSREVLARVLSIRPAWGLDASGKGPASLQSNLSAHASPLQRGQPGTPGKQLAPRNKHALWERL